MSTVKGNTVQQQFAGWYSSVSLEINNVATQEVRWRGVEALVQAAKRSMVESLIRIVFRSRQQAPGADLVNIKAKFSEVEGAETLSLGDEEFVVLTATALASLLQRCNSLSATVALSITTASMAGARKLVLPMDLLGMAEHTIRVMAEVSRRRPLIGSEEFPTLSLDAEEVMENAGTDDSAGVTAAVAALVESINFTLSTLSQRQQAVEQALHQYVRIQDEELDMLWWLQGGRSHTLDVAFSDLPIAGRSLVFARELIDATYAMPGPPALQALLIKAGLCENHDVTVPDSIAEAGISWLRNFITDEVLAKASPVTTPVHDAIKRQIELGEGDSWIAVWSRVCEIDAARLLSTIQLGQQFYRESLLLRSEQS